MPRNYPTRPELYDTLIDHTAVSEISTTGYLLDGGSKLAFWASVVSNATEALSQAELEHELALAQAMLDVIEGSVPEGSKRPTVAHAESLATINATVIQHKRAIAEIKADLEFAKRAFTTLERGGSNVRAVVNRQSAELRALGRPGES